MSGVVCSNDGDTHNSPCEQLEAKYPILFERFTLRTDSGGPGRHLGNRLGHPGLLDQHQRVLLAGLRDALLGR